MVGYHPPPNSAHCSAAESAATLAAGSAAKLPAFQLDPGGRGLVAHMSGVTPLNTFMLSGDSLQPHKILHSYSYSYSIWHGKAVQPTREPEAHGVRMGAVNVVICQGVIAEEAGGGGWWYTCRG
jgi:hypothetical protein